jgi:predicted dinucleotide-binding enzyme
LALNDAMSLSALGVVDRMLSAAAGPHLVVCGDNQLAYRVVAELVEHFGVEATGSFGPVGAITVLASLHCRWTTTRPISSSRWRSAAVSRRTNCP